VRSDERESRSRGAEREREREREERERKCSMVLAVVSFSSLQLETTKFAPFRSNFLAKKPGFSGTLARIPKKKESE
jgi:hypothetical protein